jgi:hypothetical protein
VGSWYVNAQTNHAFVGLDELQSDWASIFGSERDGVRLGYPEIRNGEYRYLDVDLTVEADDAEEARERAHAWLEARCKDAREWRRHGFVFASEVDAEDEDCDIVEVADLFHLAEPSEIDDE